MRPTNVFERPGESRMTPSVTSMSSRAVEDLVLAPACRPARAQTVVGPQVPDEGSAARTG